MISVYLETSVLSYLASKPSSDLIIAAHQKVTHDWWLHRRKYDLATSPIVEREINLGDERTAQRRIDLIKGVRLLAVTLESYKLAEVLVKKGPLPKKADVDALHISLAAIHGIEYLLSWNCKHIANVFIQKDLAKIIRAHGYECPVLCTPESMLELNK
ncbi:MAG: type II toxin-antitoxin system VapC family toxin [Candidatus Riflebacteria bacterium]|nr:type II toxin-antitoxin system VapC family toxin [Candidatus Riflebacteria bacterium]